MYQACIGSFEPRTGGVLIANGLKGTNSSINFIRRRFNND